MKIITVRPQILIGVGIILAYPLVLALWIAVAQGKVRDAAWGGGSTLVIALLVYLLCRLRIIISDDAIIVRQPFEREEIARFDDIVISRLSPNRRKPKYLNIFTHRSRKAERGDVFIPLDAFRPADVQWLLSLQSLKLE